MTEQERFKWRSCRSKTTWEHKGQASRAAKRARERGADGVRAYRCPLCTHYHIGHEPIQDAPLVKEAEQRRREKDRKQAERARLAWRIKTWKAGYAA